MLWEKLEATLKAHRESRAGSSPGGAGGRALQLFPTLEGLAAPQPQNLHLTGSHSCRAGSMEHSRVDAVVCC